LASRRTPAWLVLLIATLLPRAFLAVALGVVGAPEWWEYDVIAANIAARQGHEFNRLGFVYLAYSPPVWSYVLAALLWVFGDDRLVIQILQSLLCFGAAWLFSKLAREVTGDEGVSVLTGLLVALQPSLAYYSVVKSDPLPWNMFLLGLICLSAIAMVREPEGVRCVAFGLLVGLGVLSRGTPIVALPLVSIALIWRWKRAAARPIGIATIALAVCIGPWLVRNLILVDAFLLTSTTGENFWRGNHEGASGGVLDLDGGRITSMSAENEALPEAVRAALAEGSEADRNRVFMSEAWRFIATRPGDALTLLARKLRTFWWRIDSDPRDYPATASIAYEIIYRLELALAFLGGFAFFASGRGSSRGPEAAAAAFILSLMIAISLLQSAFYVQGRHRFMIEPLLLLFTAMGAVWMWRRILPPLTPRER